MPRLPFKLACLGLALSCASRPTGPTVKEEIEAGNVSAQSILDLARSSYLKGCVDGKKAFAPQLPSAFEVCRDMAKAHEADIQEIIHSEVQ